MVGLLERFLVHLTNPHQSRILIMLKRLLFTASLCGMAIPIAAQTIKNPTAVAFTCPDHARDDQHEIDIVRVSDGAVIQTILGGDPDEVSGEVTVAINVQPVAFGQYQVIVRAVAGLLKSDNSNPSAIWERTPGRPSGVVVR